MPAPGPPSAPGDGLPLLTETVWPPRSAQDSPTRRRRKLAVRIGHLAMAGLIAAATLGTAFIEFRDRSNTQLLGLGFVAIAYVAWNFLGTQGVVRLLLWPDDHPPDPSVRRPWGGPWFYFAIQLALAGALYGLGDRGRVPNLIWLALLPPVAYSVFLLDRPGITCVTLITLGLFVASVLRWHGWPGVARGLLAFSFAILFTLVFTWLAVSAENARTQAEGLAADLKAANLQLREYAIQAEELAATRERNRLAREIHDSLGHYLTVAHVQIQAAQALLRDNQSAPCLAALDKAQTLTREGLREIRDSVATLRASPLDNRDLPEALQQVIDEHRASGLQGHLTLTGQPRPLPPAAALTLYRAGQEALTNVRKHARASRAELTLDFHAPNTVSLQITDNGTGTNINPSEPGTHGFGLLGLRERTQLLGGRLDIRTAPGAGFTLRVEVPA